MKALKCSMWRFGFFFLFKYHRNMNIFAEILIDCHHMHLYIHRCDAPGDSVQHRNLMLVGRTLTGNGKQ